MMQFKIFKGTDKVPVDEIANKWLRTHPEAMVKEFEYGAFDEGVEFIFIMYIVRPKRRLNIRGLEWC